MSNYTPTTTTKSTAKMTWMVDYSGELVNESRTGKRDSSGKFLRQHVSMEQPVAKFSSSDVELASRFGADVDEIFMGRR